MTDAGAGLSAVRGVIDNAWSVPPFLQPLAPEPEPPPSAIISRLPIRCLGIAHAETAFPKPTEGYPTRTVALLRARNPDRELGELLATIAEAKRDASPDPVFLYFDINGLHRALAGEHHDRNGIASLFAGDRWLLSRLWSSAKRWDADRAAADLFERQGQIGIVRVPDGFERPLIAQSDAEIAAHLGIGSLTRRLLYRRVAPLHVLELARGWNRANGNPVLDDDTVVALVNGACAHELRREGVGDASAA